MHLKINNWDIHQTYRADRGTPPWIKVWRNVFSSQKWNQLTDEQRGQLVAMWVLAADRGGEIPGDPALLKMMCHMTKEPDLDVFTRLGLIKGWRQHDVKAASSCRHFDPSESESESESEKMSGKVARRSFPFKEIIKYLNLKSGSQFRHTTKHYRDTIKSRFREGAALEDFITIIDKKTAEWLGTDMEKYLTPNTLFKTSTFATYRDAKTIRSKDLIATKPLELS